MEPDGTRPCDWKEGRRRRAVELRKRGWRVKRIAAALGVSRVSVSKWLSRDRQCPGGQSWRTRPRSGRPRKLTQDQMDMIPSMLSSGAEAWGFRGDLWTCPRVADILRWQFGVRYHRAQVWRLLDQLNWSPQVPRRRATQRDEEAIQKWRDITWPELKKRPGSNLGRSSSSMRADST